MKFALYGMPCAGKTTLLNALDSRIHIVNGSAWLNKYTDGNFSRLPENEKVEWRIKYTEYLAGITDEHIISDGHYAFACLSSFISVLDIFVSSSFSIEFTSSSMIASLKSFIHCCILMYFPPSFQKTFNYIYDFIHLGFVIFQIC